MTYRGVVSNGVVVIEGEKPAEGTVVEITPVDDLSTMEACGIWKDRDDLPQDSVEAARLLRLRAERRDHGGTDR